MTGHVWTTSDGLRIAADSFGDPSAPAIVLMHGGGQTRRSWRATAERLAARGFRSITFDARGHGDSDWSPAGHYDQRALVRDLEAVVAGAGLPRPVIAGASAGGATGLVGVGDGHVAAAGLILVDIVPRTESEGYHRVRGFMTQKPDGFASIEEAADAVAAFRPDRPRPRLDGLARNLAAPTRRAAHADQRDRPPGFRDISGPSASDTCPPASGALLIRGGSSDVVSEAGAQEFLALCPHAEYVNVAGAGHMLVGDRNDVFGSAAGPFLERLLAARASWGHVND
jgi:pimeloyl-ACP methyl ester carboxylesterase